MTRAFDELRPRSWLDAFPWLKGVAEANTDPWWNESIDDTDVVTRRKYLVQVSELAMRRLTRWPIDQIFPGLAPNTDLLELRLPQRATNALFRQRCARASDLSGQTLDSIMDWRGVGVGTLDLILQALADASTWLATPTVTTGHQAAYSLPPEQSFEQLLLPAWVSSLVDDLNHIANWYVTVGLPAQPLLDGTLPPGTPQEVVTARRRLEALSAENILHEEELELDVAALFDDALSQIDPRAACILGARLFSDEPVTLDELGRLYDVTRERIRQIEGKSRGSLLTFMSEGPLAMVADAARSLIGTVRPLDDLLALIPALGNTITRVQQPAWRVLDRLDDAYEIEDDWCVVPTMTAAETMTEEALQEQANGYGVVRLDDLRLIENSQPERLPELTVSWLTHCGYIVDGNFVLTRTQSAGDYGASILSIEGSPLSAQEIVDRFAVERAAGSLRNAMSTDDRFERVDRDRWALKEWGLDAYAGVRSVIREQVERGGGRATLNDLVEFITSRYTVTASSIIAYACAPPFATREGVVRLASGDREIRKTPERTRRLFRRACDWAYRVRITTDHLRGSGSPAPVAIAGLLDLQFGQARQLQSPLGPQTVAWTGIQPSFGTIRRFLMQEDVAAGVDAFLVIHDDGTFSFEPARKITGNPLMDALSLIGAPRTTEREVARTALSAAIGLSETVPVSSVIGDYRERGDSDIADMLTSVRAYLETGHTPEQARRSVDVAEILDLL